jgi:hypothetical protein
MEWAPLQNPINFHIEEDQVASGGFRKPIK